MAQRGVANVKVLALVSITATSPRLRAQTVLEFLVLLNLCEFDALRRRLFIIAKLRGVVRSFIKAFEFGLNLRFSHAYHAHLLILAEKLSGAAPIWRLRLSRRRILRRYASLSADPWVRNFFTTGVEFGIHAEYSSYLSSFIRRDQMRLIQLLLLVNMIIILILALVSDHVVRALRRVLMSAKLVCLSTTFESLARERIILVHCGVLQLLPGDPLVVLFLLLDELLNRAVLPIGILRALVSELFGNNTAYFGLSHQALSQIVETLLGKILQESLSCAACCDKLGPVVNFDANHLRLHADHFACAAVLWNLLDGLNHTDRCIHSGHAEIKHLDGLA